MAERAVTGVRIAGIAAAAPATKVGLPEAKQLFGAEAGKIVMSTSL